MDDLNHLLLAAFTAPVAALFLRTTMESLASLTRTGAIIPLPGGRLRYSRVEIERILGGRLAGSEYLAADRAQDRRRGVNRRYYLKRRRAAPAAPAAIPQATEIAR